MYIYIERERELHRLMGVIMGCLGIYRVYRV